MKVSLIAAVAQNGTIGKGGELPWRIKDDMRFFMRTTRGHVVITGRKNFDAMGLLKNRPMIVVSRDVELTVEGAQVASSFQEALTFAAAHGESEVFVIGGAQIYALAYPYAHSFYRTTVLADVEGDVVFPELDFEGWQSEALGTGQADETNEHAFRIEELKRLEQPKPYR